MTVEKLSRLKKYWQLKKEHDALKEQYSTLLKLYERLKGSKSCSQHQI